MKQNPLSEIYSSQVLLNEEKDNVVAGQKELDSKIGKAPLVHGGAEKVKKDLEDPEEMEGSKVLTGEPKVLKDSMEKPSKAFEGSFERLFRATVNEEMDTMEMDVEIPTSNEDMVDELEGNEDEVTDLVSDLKSVMDHLQTILDKISDVSDVSEEEGEEEENEEEAEFGEEESEEEKPMGEATELKPVGKAGHSLMGKANKAGSVKPHGGKAHGGDIESDPELKPAKAHDKALQNPKSKPEVKSTVKKGEFFK